MKTPLTILFLCLTFLTLFSAHAQEPQRSEPTINKPLYTPLIERYILDELKSIRIDQQSLRSEIEKKVARIEVEQTDRAARYMTDTVANVFYVIAAATSILIFAGWNSIRDIRKNTEEIVEAKIEDITHKYNHELEQLQRSIAEQSAKILENQNRIYNTQYTHSLWMRANLETNPQSKIDIFDEILKLNPNDAEVYAYKADAVLDLDEYEWAMNLSNRAIEIDNEYGYAFWQRACANAKLEYRNEAISDLKTALLKNPSLRENIETEGSFDKIRDSEEFKNAILE